jgi:hypothetical protein
MVYSRDYAIDQQNSKLCSAHVTYTRAVAKMSMRFHLDRSTVCADFLVTESFMLKILFYFVGDSVYHTIRRFQQT